MLFGFVHITEPYFIFGMITAFVMLNLALMVRVGSKETVPRLFALATLFTALWTISIAFDYGAYALESTKNDWFFQNIVRINYSIGWFAGLSFFYFCYRMTTGTATRTTRLVRNIFIVAGFAALPLFFFTDSVIGGYDIVGDLPTTMEEALTPASIDSVEYISTYGPLVPLYNISLIVFLFGGTFLLWKKRRETDDLVLKKQLAYMFWALMIGFTAAGITNIILPVITNTDYGYIGMLTGNIWVFLVGYSIVKHNQMNVRVVAAELLIMAATLLLFVAIFV